MTSDQLILHPRLASQLASLSNQPPHAILLQGPPGVGLATIARQIADSGTLESLLEPVKKSTKQVDEQTGTITVQQIRELYEHMRSKQTKHQFVIIDNAERMGLAAQSAFLKLLEEPGAGISFILTSHFPEQLLATIRSRVQPISVPLVPDSAMRQFEAGLNIDAVTLRQLRYVAAGRPALVKRLLADPAQFDSLKSSIADAQAILTGDSYRRYTLAYSYGASQPKALTLIDTLIMLLKSSLVSSPTPKHIDWLAKLEHSEVMIYRGANPRLQLLHSVL